MRQSRFHVLVAVGLGSLLIAACGGGSGTAPVGTMSLKITDAPFPATEGCVSAAKIRITEASAKGPDGFEVLLDAADDPLEIDLFYLRAGLSESLAIAEIPTGAYTEIRLVVAEATIEFEDGTPARTFKIPSGASSGLKIKISPPLLIASGQTSELLLDVNLTKSFHTTGLGGEPTCDDLKAGESQVIFRPVIRAINEAETALVQGIVFDDGGLPLGDAEVTAFPAGAVVLVDTEAAALTLSTPSGMSLLNEGSYALALDPGEYDIYVRPQGSEARLLVSEMVIVDAGQIVSEDLTLPTP